MPSESFVGNVLSGGKNRKAALLGILGSVLESGYGANPEESSKNLTDMGGLFKLAGQEQKILLNSNLPKVMFEAMRRKQAVRNQGTPGVPEELDAVRQFLASMGGGR